MVAGGELMAKMTVVGIDKLADDLKKMGEFENEGLIDKMLDAGAEKTIEEWKTEIVKQNHVKTGDMRDSVGVSKKTKKGPKREIYPQGKDRKGSSNAQKAYILHYGKSTKKGTRFVDNINTKAEVTSYIAMQDVFDNYLKSKGLI